VLGLNQHPSHSTQPPGCHRLSLLGLELVAGMEVIRLTITHIDSYFHLAFRQSKHTSVKKIVIHSSACIINVHTLARGKIARSIPNSVIGIFHCLNPSGSTMALGSTQPLREMSARNISWRVKAAGV
jgi:hypothetical protein